MYEIHDLNVYVQEDRTDETYVLDVSFKAKIPIITFYELLPSEVFSKLLNNIGEQITNAFQKKKI